MSVMDATMFLSLKKLDLSMQLNSSSAKCGKEDDAIY